MTTKPRAVRSFDLPLFASIAQCASATGVPVSVLRYAKREGCPAFMHARVDFGAFLKWYFARGESEEAADWAKELKKAQTLRERIRLEADRKRLLDADEVRTAITAAVSKYFARIDQLAELGPAQLKGLPEMEIQRYIISHNEETKRIFRETLEQLENKQ